MNTFAIASPRHRENYARDVTGLSSRREQTSRPVLNRQVDYTNNKVGCPYQESPNSRADRFCELKHRLELTLEVGDSRGDARCKVRLRQWTRWTEALGKVRYRTEKPPEHRNDADRDGNGAGIVKQSWAFVGYEVRNPGEQI